MISQTGRPGLGRRGRRGSPVPAARGRLASRQTVSTTPLTGEAADQPVVASATTSPSATMPRRIVRPSRAPTLVGRIGQANTAPAAVQWATGSPQAGAVAANAIDAR